MTFISGCTLQPFSAPAHYFLSTHGFNEACPSVFQFSPLSQTLSSRQGCHRRSHSLSHRQVQGAAGRGTWGSESAASPRCLLMLCLSLIRALWGFCQNLRTYEILVPMLAPPTRMPSPLDGPGRPPSPTLLNCFFAHLLCGSYMNGQGWPQLPVKWHDSRVTW